MFIGGGEVRVGGGEGGEEVVGGGGGVGLGKGLERWRWRWRWRWDEG